MATNRYQTSLLRCPRCRALGAITWDAAPFLKESRTLVGLSGDFHLDSGRTGTGGGHIVCKLCDQTHSELP